MKTITIIYNTTYYVYKFRMNLINELQKLGYNVVVISPYDEYVDKLKAANIIHEHIEMSQYGMNPMKEFYITYKLYKILKRHKPVYSLNYTIKPNIFGSIAAQFAKVPVINNIAGAGKAFSDETSLFAKVIGILFKFALSKSKRVFFQNNDDMKLFLIKKIVDEKKAYRIPGSGVDLNKYHYINTNFEQTTFLFIGRLLIEKGIEDYLVAAQKVLKFFPDAKFEIVGEHELSKDFIDKAKLDEYILQHDNFYYHGAVSPDEMPLIIGNASCVVLPSFYREGVPRSLLEAAAMGKPIITTNNVGCKEVVDHAKNGYKCEIRDTECFVEAMMTFIKLEIKDKKAMSIYGRKKIEMEFDEKIVLNTYLKEIV